MQRGDGELPDAQAPALDGSYAYVALNKAGGGIATGAFAISNGARKWGVVVGAGEARSAIALANGVLYLGTKSGKVIAVNAASGATLATFTVPAAVHRIIVAGGRLFVATTTTGVHTFALPAPAP